jgi:hypothetical protein
MVYKCQCVCAQTRSQQVVEKKGGLTTITTISGQLNSLAEGVFADSDTVVRPLSQQLDSLLDRMIQRQTAVQVFTRCQTRLCCVCTWLLLNLRLSVAHYINHAVTGKCQGQG